MNKAMVVAGMCHICSNMSVDVHKRLHWWPQFYQQLKNLETVLVRREDRDLFFHLFVRNTVYDNLQSKRGFERELPRLYEQRWSRVTLFLRYLSKVILTMRKVWAPNVWIAGRNAEDEPTLDLGMLTRTLASNMFSHTRA